MSANTNRPNMGLLVAIVVVVTALLAVGGYIIATMTPWLMGPQVSTQAVQVDGSDVLDDVHWGYDLLVGSRRDCVRRHFLPR
ncbi:MAG UNVERIFIED_CONTAM: hypothetical protein LVT10_02490 [Anaerolineae bacterium]|jgi:hypothetical protein